jgi:OmpA family
MPPPKNSSLGRGLGDLMGGLPQTIGVAKHPVPATPATQDPVAVPVTPEACPRPEVCADVSPPPVLPVALASETRETAHWTFQRLALIASGIIVLFLTGAGAGAFAVHRFAVPGETRVTELPARVVVVTNTVIALTPVTMPEPLSVSEFQPLENDGVTCLAGSNGIATLVFETPLFLSRAAFDQDQAGLLSRVGEILARHAGEWDVTVTGHTDAAPLKNVAGFRDNHELGLARAMETVRLLYRNAHVPMTMLHATSAGEENPPFPGDDSESRRNNRTVTLSIRRM